MSSRKIIARSYGASRVIGMGGTATVFLQDLASISCDPARFLAKKNPPPAYRQLPLYP
jgi:hypothetical protein